MHTLVKASAITAAVSSLAALAAEAKNKTSQDLEKAVGSTVQSIREECNFWEDDVASFIECPSPPPSGG